MGVIVKAGVGQWPEVSKSAVLSHLFDVLEVDGTISRVSASPFRPACPKAGATYRFTLLAAVEDVLEPVVALEAAPLTPSQEVVSWFGELVEKGEPSFLIHVT